MKERKLNLCCGQLIFSKSMRSAWRKFILDNFFIWQKTCKTYTWIFMSVENWKWLRIMSQFIILREKVTLHDNRIEKTYMVIQKKIFNYMFRINHDWEPAEKIYRYRFYKDISVSVWQRYIGIGLTKIYQYRFDKYISVSVWYKFWSQYW